MGGSSTMTGSYASGSEWEASCSVAGMISDQPVPGTALPWYGGVFERPL